MNCKTHILFLFFLLFTGSKIKAQDAASALAAGAGMIAKGESDRVKFFDNLGLNNSLFNASTPVSSISDLLVYINTKNLDTFQHEFNAFIDSSLCKQYKTIQLSPLGYVYLKLLKKMYGDSFAISNERYFAYENSDINFLKIMGTYQLVSKKSSGVLHVTFSVKHRSVQADDIVFTPYDYQHSDFVENLSANEIEMYREKSFSSLLSLLRKNNKLLKEKTIAKIATKLNASYYNTPRYFSSRIYCADDCIYIVSIYQLKDNSNFLLFTYKASNNHFELNSIAVIDK